MSVLIDRLGQGGDGMALVAGKPVPFPGTLPGETVRPTTDGGIEILAAAPGRIDPPCRHFLDCGGCVLQHAPADLYGDWKRGLVIQALSRAGLDLPVEAAHASPPGSRRRLALAARRGPDGVVLGLNALGDKRIVALEECVVARPALVARLPGLRALSGRLLRPAEAADWLLTETPGGIDLVLERARAPDTAERQIFGRYAEEADIARISWRKGPLAEAETMALRRPPHLDWAGIRVVPPAGGFLQATAEAEAVLQGFVTAHLPGKRLLDLFAGAGALSAPLLARGAQVTAVDSTAAGLAAYQAGARAAGFGSRLKAEARDLFRRPLVPAEMKAFDGALIDPPRQGAEDQARQLARGGPARLVVIACAPAGFARDLKILIDGGYRPTTAVQVVDQFLWSAHVETMIALKR